MRRSPHLLALTLGLLGADAQFGNLNVQWAQDEASGSKDAAPRMANEKVAKQDGLTRRDGLATLGRARLEEIVKQFSLRCETCTTDGHWISRIRSGGAHLPQRRPPARSQTRSSLPATQFWRCRCAS